MMATGIVEGGREKSKLVVRVEGEEQTGLLIICPPPY